MEDELRGRLRRIHAAIDLVEEPDFSKFKVERGTIGANRTLSVDFRGGKSDEELEHLAYAAVHSVAHLRDHLRKWLKARGSDPNLVDRAIAASPALAVVIDLSEADKHGSERRDHGRSRLNPRIVKVERYMRLGGKADQSWTGVRLDPNGQPAAEGHGLVVISGTVVSSSGGKLGDLDLLLKEAVTAWEQLLGGLE